MEEIQIQQSILYDNDIFSLDVANDSSGTIFIADNEKNLTVLALQVDGKYKETQRVSWVGQKFANLIYIPELKTLFYSSKRDFWSIKVSKVGKLEKTKKTVQNLNDYINHLEIDFDSKKVIYSNLNTMVYVSSLQKNNRIELIQKIVGDDHQKVSCLCIDKKAEKLFIGYKTKVSIFVQNEFQKYEMFQTIEETNKYMYCMSFDREEKTLFTGGQETRIFVWGPDKNNDWRYIQTQKLEGTMSSISSVLYVPHIKTLFSGDYGGNITFWGKSKNGNFKKMRVLKQHNINMDLRYDLFKNTLVSYYSDGHITLVKIFPSVTQSLEKLKTSAD